MISTGCRNILYLLLLLVVVESCILISGRAVSLVMSAIAAVDWSLMLKKADLEGPCDGFLIFFLLCR